MTCFECAKEIAQYPCACGYQPKGLAVTSQWLVVDCATPGCHTAIRMKLGQQEPHPVCKWCQAGTSHALNGKPNVDIRLRDRVLA